MPKRNIVYNRSLPAAKENKNLMPFVIDAVENYCTLGEIADELRNVFGEHR
jgi:methylmalonyl-CoA mutase N-terminal domain/subunit